METYDNAAYQNSKETTVTNPLMMVNNETTVTNPLMIVNSVPRIQNTEPAGRLRSEQSVDFPNRNIIDEEERKVCDTAQNNTAMPSNSKINVFQEASSDGIAALLWKVNERRG